MKFSIYSLLWNSYSMFDLSLLIQALLISDIHNIDLPSGFLTWHLLIRPRRRRGAAQSRRRRGGSRGRASCCFFEIKRDIFSLYVLVEVLTEVLSGVQVYKGMGETWFSPLTQESLVPRAAWISDRQSPCRCWISDRKWRLTPLDFHLLQL